MDKQPTFIPDTDIDFSKLEVETIQSVIGGKLIIAKLEDSDVAYCWQTAELCDNLAEHAIYVVLSDPDADRYTTVCSKHLAMLLKLHKDGKPLIYLN